MRDAWKQRIDAGKGSAMAQSRATHRSSSYNAYLQRCAYSLLVLSLILAIRCLLFASPRVLVGRQHGAHSATKENLQNYFPVHPNPNR